MMLIGFGLFGFVAYRRKLKRNLVPAQGRPDFGPLAGIEPWQALSLLLTNGAIGWHAVRVADLRT